MYYLLAQLLWSIFILCLSVARWHHFFHLSPLTKDWKRCSHSSLSSQAIILDFLTQNIWLALCQYFSAGMGYLRYFVDSRAQWSKVTKKILLSSGFVEFPLNPFKSCLHRYRYILSACKLSCLHFVKCKLKKEQHLPARNFHGVQVYVDSYLDVTELKKNHHNYFY